MPDPTPELLTVLLASDTPERERLLRTADRPDLELALQALGRHRDAAAAEVLSLVETTVDDRGLKKLARRELHRLRSMGVQATQPVPTTPAAAPSPVETRLPIGEAWATDIDPSGSRAVWVVGERRLGGIWFSAFLLNDARGLLDVRLVDTTRKRFAREFEASRRGPGTWVSLPGEYALQLIREAVDLSRQTGGALPTRYKAFQDVFGEAPAGPARALVYETISPVEATFNPNWLDESTLLLAEPELAGWHISVPEDMRARALEVARLTTAALVVPGHSPEQQVVHLLAEASQRALSVPARRALRRRVEETAFIFVSTHRLGEARLAVAAAQAIDNGTVPAERHPLLRLLLAAGLARLLDGEMVAGRRAAEALLEVVESASTAPESRQSGGGVETRPSGLIVLR